MFPTCAAPADPVVRAVLGRGPCRRRTCAADLSCRGTGRCASTGRRARRCAGWACGTCPGPPDRASLHSAPDPGCAGRRKTARCCGRRDQLSSGPPWQFMQRPGAEQVQAEQLGVVQRIGAAFDEVVEACAFRAQGGDVGGQRARQPVGIDRRARHGRHGDGIEWRVWHGRHGDGAWRRTCAGAAPNARRNRRDRTRMRRAGRPRRPRRGSSRADVQRPHHLFLSVAARPSQKSRGAKGAAYSGVERRRPMSLSSPTASGLPSVKARSGAWQDAQDTCPCATGAHRRTASGPVRRSRAWHIGGQLRLSGIGGGPLQGGADAAGTGAHSVQATPGSMDGAGHCALARRIARAQAGEIPAGLRAADGRGRVGRVRGGPQRRAQHQ